MCAAMILDHKLYPWIMIPCNKPMDSYITICDLPKTITHTHFNTELDSIGEYCLHGWIYIMDKCFIVDSTDTKSAFNLECEYHNHAEQINNTKVLIMYMLQWFVPEDTIYYDVVLMDDVYNCNVCNMTQSVFEGFKIKWIIKYYETKELCSQYIENQICFMDHQKAINGCTLGTFECAINGTCISESYRCDFHDDCQDGLDEQNCSQYTTETTQYHHPSHGVIICDCIPWYYCCKTGECISMSNVSQNIL